MKKVALATGSILVIAGSSLWIYIHHFAAPKINVPLHQAVGRVMAEETAKLVDNRGKIVVIAIETSHDAELKVQLDEFEKTLKKFSGITVAKTYMLETENRSKYGVGSGLSGRRFIRIVNKNTTADAMPMPGVPLGPTPLTTTTSPALTAPPWIPVVASSADSNTTAGPRN